MALGEWVDHGPEMAREPPCLFLLAPLDLIRILNYDFTGLGFIFIIYELQN